MMFLAAFLPLLFVNSAFIWFLIQWSPKLGFLDHPNHRKVHTTLVPRNGGLVVFLNLVAFFYFFNKPQFLMIFLPMSLVFLGGFIDDFRQNLPASFKLFFQISASLIFLFQLNLPFPLFLIFLLFQIGITNSYNLLDNMNGVTVLLTVSQIFALVLLDYPLTSSTHFLVFFLASLFAFLIYNYPRGKIFLGDQGSQTLGFLMSQILILYVSEKLPLQTDLGGAQVLSLVLLVSGFFFIFILDTFTVIYIRLKNKKSIFQGDQNHLTHKLHRYGVSKNKVPLLLLPLQFVSSLVFGYFLQQFLGQLQLV